MVVTAKSICDMGGVVRRSGMGGKGGSKKRKSGDWQKRHKGKVEFEGVNEDNEDV